MKKENPLVRRYGAEHAWVSWRLRKVGDRMTKVPYRPSGRLASSTDPEHWDTFDAVSSVSENVGIVFRPDRLLLGIDLDHVLDENSKIRDQLSFELVAEADTYTEVSPSGSGLHLYLELDAPLHLKSNRKGQYEAYTEGRYFTVTLKSFHDEPRDVRRVTPEEAEELLAILGYPWGTQDEGEKVSPPSSPVGTDEEVMERMLRSRSGDAIRALLEIGTGKDRSSSDMSLLNHLAFWTGRDAAMMERIWLSSPLGQRKKTQERKDYRDRSIANALANCRSAYEPRVDGVAKVEEEAEVDLDLVSVPTKGGVSYLRNTENMRRILTKHPEFAGRYRFDGFSNAYETLDRRTGRWRALEDNDAVMAQTRISVLFPVEFGTIGKDTVYDAIMLVSKERDYDSAVAYVTGLKWDGKERLSTWIHSTYRTPDDPYHSAVGSNWLKGLVRRIVEPGSKFDYVLVLEGEQGTRKSTSLAVLGGPWHVETTMSTENKDFFMQFQGKAIVEFSEGETLSRTEVKRMKAIITTQVDKYRAPYSRASTDYPRRCVFAMTTNQDEYLKDETGNRRWLPVRVSPEGADTDWLAENRDQLYAEAYYRVVSLKETTHEFPYEETLLAQDSRRVTDANQDVIVEWYWKELTPYQRNDGITIHQVYKNALNGGFASRPLEKATEMRIAEVLRYALHLRKERVRVQNSLTTVWKRTDAAEEVSALERIMEADADASQVRF